MPTRKVTVFSQQFKVQPFCFEALQMLCTYVA